MCSRQTVDALLKQVRDHALQSHRLHWSEETDLHSAIAFFLSMPDGHIFVNVGRVRHQKNLLHGQEHCIRPHTVHDESVRLTKCRKRVPRTFRC